MKRGLTLLEVVIAVSLSAVLLGALFAMYQKMEVAHIQASEMKRRALGMELFEQRMARIFETAEEPDGEKLFFESIGGGLLLSYNRGVDPDPKLCGVVKGKLMLEEGRVVLTSEERTREVFFENVKRMDFSFFNPKERTWVGQWNEKGLPMIAKIEIDGDRFMFFIPAGKEQLWLSP